MTTLHIKGGKKEKISRGDIAGFVARNCDGLLQAGDIGLIEVKDHYSLVAVPRQCAHGIIARLSHARLKGHRTLVTLVRKR